MNAPPSTPAPPAATQPQRLARTGFWVALAMAALLAGFGFLLLRPIGGVEGRVQKLLGGVRWEEAQSASGSLGFGRRLAGELRDWFSQFFGGQQRQGDYYYQEELVKLGTNAVPALVRSLARDPSPAVRRVAAHSLGEIAGPGVLAGLTHALLNDRLAEVRSAAGSALASLGDTNAIPALLTSLRADREADVRGEAAGTLGLLGGLRLVPELIAAGTQETNHTVRARIAESLGELPDQRSVVLLAQWLKAPPKPVAGPAKQPPLPPEDPESDESEGETDVIASAARALGRIGGEQALQALLAHWPGETNSQIQDALCEALGTIGDSRALPLLLTALREGESDLKPSVIEALGNVGDTNAVPDLLPLLDDADQNIRTKTATALGLIGAEAGVTDLMRLAAHDPAAEVRAQACAALGAIGGARAQPVILEALPQLGDHRQDAVWALGHVGDSNAVPRLGELLRDNGRETRFAAAYALAEIGGPAAADLLAAQLADKDDYARHSKACALVMLGRTNSLPAVRASLGAKETWQRFAAALALIRLGRAADAGEWAPLQADSSKSLRDFANECAAGRALPALCGLLRDPDKALRQYAARGLDFCHDPSTLPALRQACRDPDPEVRQAARTAVHCIERRASAQH